MDQDSRLLRISDSLADVRVSVGKLESKADETRRWIDAHRQRTTQIESSVTQRFDQLHARVDATDTHLTKIGYDMSTNTREININREDIKLLRNGIGMKKTLEVALPLAVVIVALVYKIPLTELLAFIK